MNWKDEYLNKVVCGDCLDLMPSIADKSIDMILCDLPYGITDCKWDVVIPFEPLWKQYKRIIKDNGAIVLTASQPFTTMLIASNMKMFKYEWIWDKYIISNPFLAKCMPLKQHENICVFGGINYYPIMEKRNKPRKYKDKYGGGRGFNKKGTGDKECILYEMYPKSILRISNAEHKGKIHPTQKPVALFEYLIKTYTNEGDLVLDNCIGSGTTAIACIKTNRNFIGMDKYQEWVDASNERIERELQQLKLAI